MTRTFVLRFKDGHIDQLAFPNGEFSRAIVWTPKSHGEGKDVSDYFILPDEVETVEFIDE